MVKKKIENEKKKEGRKNRVRISLEAREADVESSDVPLEEVYGVADMIIKKMTSEEEEKIDKKGTKKRVPGHIE